MLIDFDGQFQAYLKTWMRENRSKYRNVDEMESQMPDVYTRWLNTPASWLDGVAPGFYFDRFSDAHQLVALMVDYMDQQVAVPDQLLDRIADLGQAAEEALLALAGDEEKGMEARMTAVGLLREMDSQRPMELYLGWLEQAKELDELCENAVESLKNMGGAPLESCLAMQEKVCPAVRECLADILCAFPGDDRVLAFLLRCFQESKNRALMASYLGKLGDERALPALEAALTDPELNYLDYVEIVAAVRELGGEVAETREFAGDPYYESLKQTM